MLVMHYHRWSIDCCFLCSMHRLAGVATFHVHCDDAPVMRPEYRYNQFEIYGKMLEEYVSLIRGGNVREE